MRIMLPPLHGSIIRFYWQMAVMGGGVDGGAAYVEHSKNWTNHSLWQTSEGFTPVTSDVLNNELRSHIQAVSWNICIKLVQGV